MRNGTIHKYYAGIGARATPNQVLHQMEGLALTYSGAQYILRSGGAAGADSAWQNGSRGHFQLFEAAHATNEAIKMASQFHPNWKACNQYVTRLHGRNMMILFGPRLDEPADFVCCWTPGGKATGGTGQALRAAEHFGIPIFNLAVDEPPGLAKIKACSEEMFKIKSVCHTTINRSNMR
jgi:hypothetical protein